MESNTLLSYFSDKTILVTGASGYIGYSITKKLSDANCNILTLVRTKEKFIAFQNSKAKITVVEADIRQKDIWKHFLKGVDILFHLAAQTSSKVANSNPTLDIETNLLPVINIIETCQKENFHPDIIFSGTATQVGLTETYPVDERVKDNPTTVYDINKLSAEKYLQYYGDQTPGKAVTLRLANIYGPGPKSSSTDRGIVNTFIKKALNGDTLTIYGGGNFIRDYSFIDDITNAFLLSAKYIDSLNGKYFYIGNGNGYTFKEVIKLIRDTIYKKAGMEVDITHVEVPHDLSPIESRNFVANYSNFRKFTNWHPKVSLQQGINKTTDCFLKETER